MTEPTEQETYRRSIDAQFDTQDQTLAQILQQVMKTNGRVSKLENWRFMLIGAWAVLSFIVVSIAIPVVLTLMSAAST